MQLSARLKRNYHVHGWTEEDIQYLADNATKIHDHKDWSMAEVLLSDGTMWLYPTSQNNNFPLSLWKEIAKYILENPKVIIPMNRNQKLVASAAKRWNGYLCDNLLYLFGDELKGLHIYEGGKRWSNLKTTLKSIELRP